MVYHMVMARKQVLVQLDDDLVARLDELAAHLAVSRSRTPPQGRPRHARTGPGSEEAEQSDDRRLPEAAQDPDWVATATRLAAETAPEW